MDGDVNEVTCQAEMGFEDDSLVGDPRSGFKNWNSFAISIGLGLEICALLDDSVVETKKGGSV